MVERQIEARGVRDPRVLQAMLAIPREQFIPEEYRHLSFDDEPVSIGFGQTISQPYMTALMAECLELKGTETVLDVGSGSGYHAAVLGALAARVISIEIIPELAGMARENLDQTGLGGNVMVVCGDGSRLPVSSRPTTRSRSPPPRRRCLPACWSSSRTRADW